MESGDLVWVALMAEGDPVRKMIVVPVVALVGTLAVVGVTSVATSAETPPSEASPVADPDVLPEEDYASGEAQAELVAQEDSRISLVQSTALRAQVRSMSRTGTPGDPAIVRSTSPATIVLSPRDNPYTMADLVRISQGRGAQQEDGATTLDYSVFVPQDATLELSGEVRLSSGTEGFASIVSYGGLLRSDPGSGASVTSWDPETQAPDALLEDGRAYVRSVGGEVDIHDVDFESLGFWSGRTGGVALTGIDPRGLTEEEATLEQYALSGVAGPGLSTGTIAGSSFTNGTYGLFLSSSEEVSVTDSIAADNQLDGFALHRSAAGTALTDVRSNDNGSDGVSVSSGATDTVLSGVSAAGNGERGILLDGSPLAEGPSPSGEPVGNSSGTLVLDASLEDNPRGVEVIGGTGMSITQSTIRGGVDGIILRDLSESPSVADNTIVDVQRYGVILRDGVVDAEVTGNTVRGAGTGLHLRDSVGALSENTVTTATNHGASIVGLVAGSSLVDNSFSGHGPSAVDDTRLAPGVELADEAGEATASSALVAGNEGEWTRPFLSSALSFVTRPLSLIWLGIIALVAFTAFARRRVSDNLPHPYQRQESLETILQRNQARTDEPSMV